MSGGGSVWSVVADRVDDVYNKETGMTGVGFHLKDRFPRLLRRRYSKISLNWVRKKSHGGTGPRSAIHFVIGLSPIKIRSQTGDRNNSSPNRTDSKSN